MNERRRASKTAGLLLLFSLSVPPCLEAQSPPHPTDLQAGERVRVTADGLTGSIVGDLDAFGPGGLSVLPAGEGDVLTIPAQAIDRLEVSLGKRSFLERAVPGGLIGAALGAALGAITYSDPCAGPDPGPFCGLLDPGRGGNAATFGILGLLAGGAIAAVAVPSERWTEVQLATTP